MANARNKVKKAQQLVNSLLDEAEEGLPVDPQDPEPSMAEVHRHLPTKEVRLRGNAMLYAPGVIRAAQYEWQHSRQKKQREWAKSLIKVWIGLPEQLYIAILDGKCDIIEDGNDAVLVIRPHAQKS